jgi:general stress protein CsbA
MWPRIVNVILGVWLMAAPAILNYGDPAQTNDRIVGPIAAAFAVIAIWEVTRSVRWVNTMLGLWLLVAPWILGYDSSAAILNSLVAGAIMALVSMVRGKVTQHYGGGWSSLWRSDNSNTA